MSVGFTKWSNNDGSNLNIRAIRFGFKKPILEAELNELQDLAYISSLNASRMTCKHNTYSSDSDCTVYWKYVENADGTTTAHLMLKSTSKNDVVKFRFSGGVEYFVRPTLEDGGEEELVAFVLDPTDKEVGTIAVYRLDAVTKSYSPDPSDSDYNEAVDFAVDERCSGLITTKRVVVDSDFSLGDDDADGEFAHLEHLTGHEYNDLCERIKNHRVYSLNDKSVAMIILGAWELRDDGSWSFVYEVQKELLGITAQKLDLLSDGIETFGNYSVTPLVEGETCEVRLNLPVQSIKFGYFALAVDGVLVTEATPVNHPLRTGTQLLTQDRVSILLYDLRDIVLSDDMWGNYTGQSWEDLLNQQWFAVDDYSTPSLELTFREVSSLKDVVFGSLMVKR